MNYKETNLKYLYNRIEALEKENKKLVDELTVLHEYCIELQDRNNLYFDLHNKN
jgi:cell division protein FtsB